VVVRHALARLRVLAAEKSAWQSTQAWSGWTEALIFSWSMRIE